LSPQTIGAGSLVYQVCTIVFCANNDIEQQADNMANIFFIIVVVSRLIDFDDANLRQKQQKHLTFLFQQL
jgi:hypothetical protein